MPSRRALRRWAIIVAGVVAGAAGLATLSPAPVGVLWDDAVYLLLGKALATGEGYRYIHLPGEPAATLYPPLWPALLSAVWRVAPDFPESLRWLRLLNPLLLGAVGATTTLLMTRITRTSPIIAALAMVACIATTPMLMVSSGLMSEPLGMTMMALTLLAATSIVERGSTRDGVLAGMFAGLALLARSASIVLFAALAAGLLWKRSRRASTIALVIALVPAIAWFTWTSTHAHEVPDAIAGSYGPYLTWMLDGYRAEPALLLDMIRTNATTVFRELGIVIFGVLPSPLRAIGVTILLATLAIGLPFTGRRAVPLTATLVAYAALVLIWPYNPGRFVWAFLPFAAIATITAARAIRLRRHRLSTVTPTTVTPTAVVPAVVALPALAPTLVALTAVITLAVSDSRGLKNGWHSTALEQNAKALLPPLSFISRHTSPSALIASDVHLPAALYLDRKVVPVSNLTVVEYLRPKSKEAITAELAAIDSTFHPTWFVIGSPALANALESIATSHEIIPLPTGGHAARRLPAR